MDTNLSISHRIENLPRSRLFISSCFFIAMFIASLLFSLTLAPKITSENSVSIYKCSKDYHKYCFAEKAPNEIWQALIPNTNRLSQFLYMSVKPYSSKSVAFNLSMEIEVLNGKHILQKRTKSKEVNCEKSCGTIPIFYIPYLEYSNYEVTIKHNSQVLSDSIEINLSHINEGFTKYQVIMKFAFFVLSVVSFIQFFLLILKAPKGLKSFESLTLIPLGVSLMVFNEPLLLATIYNMNAAWSAFSVFSNLQFLAFLLLFWFLELHHLSNSKFKVIYLFVETAAVFFLVFFSFQVFLHLHQEARNNLNYDWQHDLSGKYKEAFIGVIVVSSLLMAWILVLAFSTLNQVQKLSSREKIIKILSLAMIGFSFTGLFTGAFQPIPRHSSLFLVFFSGLNLYVICLQYYYSPTKSSLLDNKLKKIKESLFNPHEYSIELT